MPIEAQEVLDRRGNTVWISPVLSAQNNCAGCELTQNNISCSVPTSCYGVVWIMGNHRNLRPDATGPYHEAYRIMVARRKTEDEEEQYANRYARQMAKVDWNDPVERVCQVQQLIARTRGVARLELANPVKEALRKFGLPKNWHELCLQFPQWKRETCELIQYFPDERSLDRYNETFQESKRGSTRVGRYLKMHWPHISDHQIRDLAALYGRAQVKIVRDMAYILKAVNSGPGSCMQWNLSDEYDGCYDMDGIIYENHPYEVYDPELGWGMAIVEEGGKIIGRALIYEKDGLKCFVRSYGKESDGYTGASADIDAYLKSKGYQFLNAWPEGVEIKFIPADNAVGFISPYIDPGPQRIADNGRRFTLKVEGDKKRLIRDNEGDYDLDDTEGCADYSPTHPIKCPDCGTSLLAHHGFTVGYATTRRTVCESCAINYVHAYIDIDGNHTAMVEKTLCGYVPSRGVWFLKTVLEGSGNTRFVECQDGNWEYPSATRTFNGKRYSTGEITGATHRWGANPYIETLDDEIHPASEVVWAISGDRSGWMHKSKVSLMNGYYATQTVYERNIRAARSAQAVAAMVEPENLNEAIAIWTEAQERAYSEVSEQVAVAPTQTTAMTATTQRVSASGMLRHLSSPLRVFESVSARMPQLARRNDVSMREWFTGPMGTMHEEIGRELVMADFSNLEFRAIAAANPTITAATAGTSLRPTDFGVADRDRTDELYMAMLLACVPTPPTDNL